MTPFSVSKSSHKYRIVGMTAQRPALPLSTVAAWREAALFGLPAGALLALPVTLRSGTSFTGGVSVWLAACGLLGLAVTLSAGLLRAGRPLPSSVTLVPMGLMIALGPIAFLGKLLYANTHHRPLGAATFSMLSLAIILGAMAMGARARRLLNSSNPGKQKFGRILLYGGVAVSLLFGLREFVALLGSAKAHPAYLGALLDGLLGLALSLVGGFSRFPVKFERLAKVAGPLAIVICILLMLVGFKAAGTSAALARSSALWFVFKPS
jgi:hypothetical protein